MRPKHLEQFKEEYQEKGYCQIREFFSASEIKRIEETLFQHNYNPKKSLNISVKAAEKPILLPAQPQASGSKGECMTAHREKIKNFSVKPI